MVQDGNKSVYQNFRDFLLGVDNPLLNILYNVFKGLRSNDYSQNNYLRSSGSDKHARVNRSHRHLDNSLSFETISLKNMCHWAAL